MLQVYSRSPTLDREIDDLYSQLYRQYMSAETDRKELRRLRMEIRRTKDRYIFDHTVLSNWLIFVIGTIAMIGCIGALKLMQ